MNIPEILVELRKMLPEENFHIEPETSKVELMNLERKYDMSTYEFVNTKKDISHINEDERYYWLNTMETYCNFGGIIEGVND